MPSFGLKQDEEFENWAAHPYQEFRRVPPPRASREPTLGKFGFTKSIEHKGSQSDKDKMSKIIKDVLN